MAGFFLVLLVEDEETQFVAFNFIFLGVLWLAGLMVLVVIL